CPRRIAVFTVNSLIGCLRVIFRDHGVQNAPVSSSAMNHRSKNHLSAIKLFNGETPHGLRSGCAISLKKC
ncbi:uncharacterized protein LOC126815300, partial [Patella vulgata]|uniref:uncharacterized protein LOC126815300 n=1 Tax=Patella vulgata TaxID=6465 RepID=UPI0021806943